MRYIDFDWDMGVIRVMPCDADGEPLDEIMLCCSFGKCCTIVGLRKLVRLEYYRKFGVGLFNFRRCGENNAHTYYKCEARG